MEGGGERRAGRWQVRNAEGSPWWRRAHAARGLPGSGTVACFNLPAAPCGWQGPRLTISLPSFR